MNNSYISSAFNPRLKRKENRPPILPDEQDEDGPEKDHDKIDLFGDNPDWEPGWVKAYRVNFTGQVGYELVMVME